MLRGPPARRTRGEAAVDALWTRRNPSPPSRAAAWPQVAFAISGASIACLRPVLDTGAQGWAMVWAILTAVAVAGLLLQLLFLRTLLHRDDEEQQLYRGGQERGNAGAECTSDQPL